MRSFQEFREGESSENKFKDMDVNENLDSLVSATNQSGDSN